MRTEPLTRVLVLVVSALRSPHTIHAYSDSPSPPPPPPEPPWSPLVFAPPVPPAAQSGEVELLQNDRLNMPMSAELLIRNEGVPWYENRFKEAFDRRCVARRSGSITLRTRQRTTYSSLTPPS